VSIHWLWCRFAEQTEIQHCSTDQTTANQRRRRVRSPWRRSSWQRGHTSVTCWSYYRWH